MNPRITAAAVAGSILTKVALAREPNRSLCGRCRGKGFDCFEPNRASRRCPRCRGAGSTEVGSTKR
jgi:DnaJ-class molecular chaperone